MKKFVAYITERDAGEDVYDKETIIEANNEEEALEKWLAINRWFLKLIGAERTDDKTIPGYAAFAYAKNHLHFKVTMKEGPIMTEKELREKLNILEYDGVVSRAFIHTIGLDDDMRIVDSGKKVICYRNYYYNTGVSEDIQNYIDKGYMECISEGNKEHYWYFKVTELGFAWLSALLGIEVEEYGL